MENEIEQFQNVLNIAIEFTVNYGFQIIGAIIILFVGWQVAKWISRLVFNLCNKYNLDVTISRFIANVAKTLVLIFVIIIALGKFGITIAPFIAALGAIIFGSTLALQGPISNYGAGLTIIFTRPFVVGDTIRIKGVVGIVEEIKLAYTQLSNEDGELITIPNNQIVGEIIHNSFANLVVESEIGISYDSDSELAISIIKNTLSEIDEVDREPAPQVGIASFGDSAVILGVRYWIPTKKYYQVMYNTNQKIFTALKSANINIPYPQRDVRIINQ